MKKILISLFVGVTMCSTASAQSFVKGTNALAAGIGFGGSFGSFTYGSQSPGISVQYEKGVWEVGGPGVISLGGYAGTKGYKYSGTAGDIIILRSGTIRSSAFAVPTITTVSITRSLTCMVG